MGLKNIFFQVTQIVACKCIKKRFELLYNLSRYDDKLWGILMTFYALHKQSILDSCEEGEKGFTDLQIYKSNLHWDPQNPFLNHLKL